MKIFYIHGANATPGSFNYLSNKINHPAEFANYSSSDGFFNNLDQMKQQLAQGQWFLVSHSLGGVYSAHLSSFLGSRMTGAVSVSTPYGGSELSDMLMLVHPFTRLFRDTGSRSRPIVEAQKIIQQDKHCKWTAVVTSTGRAPYLPGFNDGVVSLTSQTVLHQHMDIVQIDCNHYEILQNDQVLNIIQDRLFATDPQQDHHPD